jgi:hypothetical protein
MGRHWDEFKDRVGEKSVGFGMILTDLVVLVILATLMIAADQGRERIVEHIGKGNLFTQITLIVVEIILDVSAIIVVFGWLKKEIEELFQ